MDFSGIPEYSWGSRLLKFWLQAVQDIKFFSYLVSIDKNLILRIVSFSRMRSHIEKQNAILKNVSTFRDFSWLHMSDLIIFVMQHSRVGC